jgi:hypothetical protein
VDGNRAPHEGQKDISWPSTIFVPQYGQLLMGDLVACDSGIIGDGKGLYTAVGDDNPGGMDVDPAVANDLKAAPKIKQETAVRTAPINPKTNCGIMYILDAGVVIIVLVAMSMVVSSIALGMPMDIATIIVMIAVIRMRIDAAVPFFWLPSISTTLKNVNIAIQAKSSKTDETMPITTPVTTMDETLIVPVWDRIAANMT